MGQDDTKPKFETIVMPAGWKPGDLVGDPTPPPVALPIEAEIRQIESLRFGVANGDRRVAVEATGDVAKYLAVGLGVGVGVGVGYALVQAFSKPSQPRLPAPPPIVCLPSGARKRRKTASSASLTANKRRTSRPKKTR